MTELPDFQPIPAAATPIVIRHDRFEALVVFSPDLDPKTVERLKKLDGAVLAGGSTAPRRRPPGARFLAAASQPGMSYYVVILPCTAAGLMALLPGPVGLGLLGTSYTVAAGKIWAKMRKDVPLDKLLGSAGGGYVHGQWLLPEHTKILSGAVNAAKAIEDSNVVLLDLVDATKIRVRMPQILWDIAHTLHEASNLRAELDAVKGRSAAPAKALDLVEKSVQERLAALETCASQLAQADCAYRDLMNQETIQGIDSRIMDLVARTSVENTALNDIREISAQATAAADAFKKAQLDAIAAIDAALALEPR